MPNNHENHEADHKTKDGVEITLPLAPKSVLIMDECWSSIGFNDDSLKEELRRVEGIPNADYVVNDSSKVFVFEKLVQLVKDEPGFSNLPEAERKQRILELFDKAWVTPAAAVEEWDIVPDPYKVLEFVGMAPFHFAIYHRAFNASIPKHYATREDVNEALSLLLIGEVITSTEPVDFTYRNQGFKLLESFSLDKLPPRPELGTEDLPSGNEPYSGLSFEFVDGFEPISKETHHQLTVLASTWHQAIGKAVQFAYRSAAQWSIAAKFPLAALNRSSTANDENEELAALRTLYPELKALTDAELYNRFDSYQSECLANNGWDAIRDDDFLLYLLGRLASNEGLKGDDAREAGAIVAYTALRFGMSPDNSFKTAVACHKYSESLWNYRWRAWQAMRFLEGKQKSTDLRGDGVKTFRDIFRIARKTNGSTILPITKQPLLP